MNTVLDILTYLALALLSLDTLRAIIAMIGWVKPNAKYSWIIYGRYSKNLVESTLKELGFSSTKSKLITKKIKEITKEVSNKGVTEENAVKLLISILAKYTVKFENPIQYGGTKTTKSDYYIDTMEISHHEEDREMLSAIMVLLVNKKTKASKKPNTIITPKGGNPLFAMEVAELYGASFLMAKSKADKSRIKSINGDDSMSFKINYEGALHAEKLPSGKCIILDCNTSGGSQLLDIVNDIQNVATKIDIPIPKEIYVLFRADERHSDIDKKFSDRHCTLYRFFDLDEETKKDIYDLKVKYENNGQAELDIYYKEVDRDIEAIITKIKNKNNFHYE